MVMGNPKDERTFSIVNFMESKLHNHLIVHRDLVVEMYVQELYKLETFPFYTISSKWGREKLVYEEQ
jgi:hypothetical protein